MPDLRPNRDEHALRPDRCPFCDSKAVGTHAKEITSATYWHCQNCGETWNVGRVQRSTRL